MVTKAEVWDGQSSENQKNFAMETGREQPTEERLQGRVSHEGENYQLKQH